MTAIFGPTGRGLSVMVPTYNCSRHLRQTLASLAAESEHLADSQVVVVDDASDDRPEDVVAEFASSLSLTFHRHAQNLGSCANFRACVDLAHNDWVHILHGDDFVLPGAYSNLRRAHAASGDAEAVFGRAVTVDAGGSRRGVSPPLGPQPCGRLEYDLMTWRICPVQFAGVVFSKAAIDRVGTFDCSFQHAQDWNLWWRIASRLEVAYTNESVGAYRVFAGSHTSSLVRQGVNIAEYREQLARILDDAKSHGSPAPPAAICEPIFIRAFHQSLTFAGSDRRAFWLNARETLRVPGALRHGKHLGRLALAALARR